MVLILRMGRGGVFGDWSSQDCSDDIDEAVVSWYSRWFCTAGAILAT